MTHDTRYILLLSVHGLIRGQDLELGRDADTGGQTKYVLELAQALARREDVRRVDLLTRWMDDPHAGPDYARKIEPLDRKARIIRLPAGPADYIRKEELWDHLDSFADHAVDFLHRQGDLPDVIHSHYADAGYVGLRMAGLLGVPLVHTGHSLGRVKRRRLLAKGLDRQQMEEHYNLSRRIQAEEDVLAAAECVITSTNNEIGEQYALYDHHAPERMRVIPPGTDLERFYPPRGGENDTAMYEQIRRFLRQPEKPMILALARPDERKNLAALVHAYGRSEALQEMANLVIVAGNRDDLHDLDPGAENVITELLYLMDRYDLYGRVAYPKHHQADDVPLLYRIAAAHRGVFVNPALTEPFGLTLLEAAASGLPVVATEDGGPQDIIGLCDNGILVDPLDHEAIAAALETILADADLWERCSANGEAGVSRHYSWDAHADKYLQALAELPASAEELRHIPLPEGRHFRDQRNAMVLELDTVLLGSDEAERQQLMDLLRQQRHCTVFVITTGRNLESALKMLKSQRIPVPDVLITGMGTEVYYAPRFMLDLAWNHHIDHAWSSTEVRRLLDPLPGLGLQPKSEQLRFKISYYFDAEQAPSLEEIQTLLHQHDVRANAFLSHGQYLDILPLRASKGMALRFVAEQWQIPLARVMVAGATGAEEDMMRGNTLGAVIPSRHLDELHQLEPVENIYFSRHPHASGVLEAIDHYNFFAECPTRKANE